MSNTKPQPSAERFLAISELEFMLIQQLISEIPVKQGYTAHKILLEGVAARPLVDYTTEVPSIVTYQQQPTQQQSLFEDKEE